MKEVDNALEELELFYLDWFNNYVSVEKFAELRGISESKALAIINVGKMINHSGVRNE